MGYYWRRTRRFIIHNILHADDTPHRIALGVAIATLIAFLPLIGIQMVLAVAVATFLGGNKAVCIPIVWITNPFTFVPIYSGCLWIGRAVMPNPIHESTDHSLSQLAHIQVHLLEPGFWKEILDIFTHLGIDLWVGCSIVGTVTATIGYLVTRRVIQTYRETRRRRILRRTQLRAEAARLRIRQVTKPA